MFGCVGRFIGRIYSLILPASSGSEPVAMIPKELATNVLVFALGYVRRLDEIEDVAQDLPDSPEKSELLKLIAQVKVDIDAATQVYKDIPGASY